MRLLRRSGCGSLSSITHRIHLAHGAKIPAIWLRWFDIQRTHSPLPVVRVHLGRSRMGSQTSRSKTRSERTMARIVVALRAVRYLHADYVPLPLLGRRSGWCVHFILGVEVLRLLAPLGRWRLSRAIHHVDRDTEQRAYRRDWGGPTTPPRLAARSSWSRPGQAIDSYLLVNKMMHRCDLRTTFFLTAVKCKRNEVHLYRIFEELGAWLCRTRWYLILCNLYLFNLLLAFTLWAVWGQLHVTRSFLRSINYTTHLRLFFLLHHIC